MKARPTNSTLGGMAVLATILTILFTWGVASAADFHQPGIDCTDCHDMTGASTNISMIREEIELDGPYAVTFLLSPDDYARADNAGVCEACHYDTKSAHIDLMELELVEPYNQDDCTTCHGTHCADTPNVGDPGMFSTGAMPDNSGHNFHTDVDVRHGGPIGDCQACHVDGVFTDPEEVDPEVPNPAFIVGLGGCDNCHSPGGAGDPGAFDGLYDPDVGVSVLANWIDGVYNEDGTLKAGKGEWCATCHDDVPASSEPSAVEIVVDDADGSPDATFVPDCATPGSCNHFSEWTDLAGLGHNGTLRYMAIKSETTGGAIDGTATWRPNITQAGEYKVYAKWNSNPYRSKSVTYTIYYNDGTDSVPVTVDQTANGGDWYLLDTLNFNAGTSCYVELSNDAPANNPSANWVIADAIMLSSGTAGTNAPNVVGNNTDYGFYINGHGPNEILGCLDCHDASKDHIDGVHRTYSSGDGPSGYQAGYRLRDVDGVSQPMLIPRPQHAKPENFLEDFGLCLDCHNLDEVIGKSWADKSQTNFKSDGKARNQHNYHLGRKMTTDTDWDGVIDSYVSCITCHNVHGAPNQAMIRHGELIDNDGALNFCYLPSQDLGSCDTGASLQGSVGSLIAPRGKALSTNGMCSMNCHYAPVGPGSEDLFRDPPYLGPKVIQPKADPESVVIDGGPANVLLTVFILDHSSPFDVSSVTVDLSSVLGTGFEAVVMLDDGNVPEGSGDENLGDRIYSCLATVPETVDSGDYDLKVTATDANSTGENTMTLLVMKAGVLIVDDTDATVVPDCTPGSCDHFSEWNYYSSEPSYGTGGRYMAIKSETTGGTIDGTVTWTPNITLGGQYSVYAMWHSNPYRSHSVTYTIYYNDGTDSVEVTKDQTTGGGDWNYLDTRNFNAGTSCYVKLSNDAPASNPTATWVTADAIKFGPPADMYTISGNISALDGVTVSLSGDVEDSTVTAGGGSYSFTVPDGNYTVTPSLDGYGFVPGSQDVGVSGSSQTADFVANYVGIIVDDPDATFVPDCATPGSCDHFSEWTDLAGLGHNGTLRYMAIKSETTGGTIDGTATWTPTIPSTGLYKVYAKWHSNQWRSDSVTYTIYYNDGTDSVEVTKDQTTGGGDWNYLDTRNFNAGTSCYVKLTNDAPASDPAANWVIADAIQFEAQ